MLMSIFFNYFFLLPVKLYKVFPSLSSLLSMIGAVEV